MGEMPHRLDPSPTPSQSDNTEDETHLDLDYAHPTPESQQLWDTLFPNGKPTPEEFIRALAELVKSAPPSSPET